MRMMRFDACFVVLYLVVICSAQEKCCVKPDMFAVTSGSLIGWHVDQYFGTLSQSIFTVSDFTQSRFLNNVTSYENTNVTYILLIEDYKQNVGWTIDLLAKKCQKAPLPEGKEKPVKCVPDNAIFIQQVNNPGDVLVNMWYYDYKTPTENGVASIGVTVDECLPTGTSFVGTSKSSGQDVDVLDGIGYYNFEALTDVSHYFKLPPFCDSKSNEVIKTKATEAAKRFVKTRRFL